MEGRFRDLEGKQSKKTFDKHADAKEFYATTKAAVDRVRSSVSPAVPQ